MAAHKIAGAVVIHSDRNGPTGLHVFQLPHGTFLECARGIKLVRSNPNDLYHVPQSRPQTRNPKNRVSVQGVSGAHGR